MFMLNGAFYPNSEIDTPITDKPYFVTSCGHHIMLKKKHFDTIRPNGRRDYQLLFVKKGRIYYSIDDAKSVCEENSILIYRPFEPQFYTYTLSASADIYWIHFTGNEIESILAKLNLSNGRCFEIIPSDKYAQYFDQIIYELQTKSLYYTDIANLTFETLLFAFSRQLKTNNSIGIYSFPEINSAITYLNAHFNEQIDMEAYAISLNISIGWFTKLFRKQTNTTPHRYLVDLRIAKAKSLLCSSVSIHEIASMVGFEDPFYFSRIFQKTTGMSPTKYRKMHSTLDIMTEDNVPW